MRIVEIDNDPSIALLVEMLQRLSAARTAQEAFAAFMERYWRLRPVDHFIGVIPDGSGPGRYRITFRASAARLAAGEPVPARNLDFAAVDALPVHEGGVIGRMIAPARPLVVEDLDLSNDPVLGSEMAAVRTGVALPVFAGAAVVEWVLAFSRRENGLSVPEMHQALITSNFMGMANAQLMAVHEVKRLNRRLIGQFEEVSRLQQALLPERIPDIPGLAIATSYLTCDHAGGDYFDFFPLSDGRWGILIADASGHGAAAAAVMAMMHAIIHSFSGPDCCPDEILRFANTRLVSAGIEGNFVTAFLAIYNPGDATLVYACGGHHPPRLKSGSTGAVSSLDSASGLPLGILEPYEIEAGKISLAAGDSVVLYTDGITEEFNSRREMFGVDRLDSALIDCSGEPDCVIDSVHRALYEHTGSRTRADDQTLVAFRYRPGVLLL